MLLNLRVRFPYHHDLAELLDLVQKAGKSIPKPVRDAGRLTRFAVVTRYPGIVEPIAREDYKRAVRIAEKVLRWAETLIAKKP